MLLRQIDQTAPVEPVTVADFKAAARIDGTEFDLLIPGAISAARQQAEHQTGRQLAQRTVRLELDDWPTACERLPVVPAEAAEVQYHDGTTWQTLSSSLYALVPTDSGCTLQPTSGATWPTLPDIPGARVRADISTAANPCPPTARTYVIAQAAHWLDNPAASADRRREPTPFLQHLLDAVRVYG